MIGSYFIVAASGSLPVPPQWKVVAEISLFFTLAFVITVLLHFLPRILRACCLNPHAAKGEKMSMPGMKDKKVAADPLPKCASVPVNNESDTKQVKLSGRSFLSEPREVPKTVELVDDDCDSLLTEELEAFFQMENTLEQMVKDC